MAKKRYHSAMISESSAACHLPQDVIVKSYQKLEGQMNDVLPDLFSGVEKALKDDRSAMARNKKVTKAG